MGIPGLLKNLKSITSKCHISKFKGLKVGIDAHCWLHRGAYSCAREISQGLYTTKFVSFFLDLIALLLANEIDDIVVIFDGGSLPIKSEVNSNRHDKRKLSFELAVLAESLGDLKLAYTHYQSAIAITSSMVYQLVSKLQASGIRFLISPYESDAQLAYMSQLNQIDVVISEDSDSIVYGCKQVFFKMDSSGNGEHIKRCDLAKNKDLSFSNWSDDQFKLFCCLSGCDYMSKLRNIGVKTAHKIVSKYRTFAKVCDHLRSNAQSNGFDDISVAQLERAMLTFKHQTVYNTSDKRMQPLTPLPEHTTKASGEIQRGFNEDVSFLGPILDASTAAAIATGRMDPITRALYGENNAPTSSESTGRKMGERAEKYLQSIQSLSLEERRAMLYGKCLPCAKSGPLEKTTRTVHPQTETPQPSGLTSHQTRVLFSTSSIKAALSLSNTASSRVSTPPEISWAFDCPETGDKNVSGISATAIVNADSYTSNVYNSSLLNRDGGAKKRTRRTAAGGTAKVRGVESEKAKAADMAKFQQFAFRSAPPIDSLKDLTKVDETVASLKRARVNWSGLDNAFSTPGDSLRTGEKDKRQRHDKATYSHSHSDGERDFSSPSGLPRDRAQFVSPLVSSRFMTLSRRQMRGRGGVGGVRPLDGLAVSMQRDETHSVSSSRQMERGGAQDVSSYDHHDHNASVEGGFSGNRSRFFDGDLFNSPHPCREGDSAPRAHSSVVSASCPSSQPVDVDPFDELLFRDDENQAFHPLPPAAAGIAHHHSAAHDVIPTGSSERHGILPPSPVRFKAARQIEDEMRFVDTSLGELSPSLPRNRGMYTVVDDRYLQPPSGYAGSAYIPPPPLSGASQNSEYSAAEGSLWSQDAPQCFSFSAPASYLTQPDGQQSLWNEAQSSRRAFSQFDARPQWLENGTPSCHSTESFSGSGAFGRPSPMTPGGFSAYYLPQRSRGVFPHQAGTEAQLGWAF